MKVYSLSKDDTDFIGCENDGVMVNLTRAITLYEGTRSNDRVENIMYIDELLLYEKLTLDYLTEVLDFVSDKGLNDEISLKIEFIVNAPLFPGKIIALGQNYREHAKEMNMEIPDEPVLFGKWPSNVIGPNEPIVKPSWIGRMDYEAELAFVIGKRAKQVKSVDAMEYIAGYTCLNDVSARDIQKKHITQSLPWMLSKNFDTFCPMGPCILLADTMKEPLEFTVQSSVNGKIKQNGNTRDFIFDIPTIIEYISKIMTLEPGDVVTTGTPSGVGPLVPGDIVEITCSGIGTLINPVVTLD